MVELNNKEQSGESQYQQVLRHAPTCMVQPIDNSAERSINRRTIRLESRPATFALHRSARQPRVAAFLCAPCRDAVRVVASVLPLREGSPSLQTGGISSPPRARLGVPAPAWANDRSWAVCLYFFRRARYERGALG
jgi:hypothetical protein